MNEDCVDLALRLIEVARGYVGTPFHHAGRLPGVGLDCIGVPVCAATRMWLRR